MFRYALALATLTFSFNAFAQSEFVDVGSVRVAVEQATQRFLSPYIDVESKVGVRVKSETQTDRIFEVAVTIDAEQMCSVEISVNKTTLASQPVGMETCKFSKDQEAVFTQIQKNQLAEDMRLIELERQQQLQMQQQNQR